MLPVASGFEEVLPGVLRWSAFSPHHKVELTSNLVRAGAEWFLFDPIPLDDAARERLLRIAPVSAIVLTNANHERDSAEWRERTGATVFAPRGTLVEIPQAEPLPDGRVPWRGWELLPLDGGALGETAFRLCERPLVVFGDAMFHLPEYGLDVLPAKYCLDNGRLREQLRALCAEAFDTALFAHGTPLPHAASQQIAARLQRSAQD